MREQQNSYRGFDLKKITLGYRDIFRNAIDSLYQEELLGAANEEATETFFALLNKSNDNTCFDHVLKHFLESLSSENNWIMRIPALFSDWTSLGADFASHKTYMGLKYFEIWGNAGFGTSPDDVTYVIQKSRFLMKIDMEFAYFFIFSYKKLSRYLDYHGIDVFVDNALKLFSRNPKNAYNFLQLKTKTSRLYVKHISREVRLADVRNRLQTYLMSISGAEMQLDDLGSLDSDDLIERGTMVVSLAEWLYFPAKASAFSSAQRNFDYYMVTATLCAGAYMLSSFNTIHGSEGTETSLDLFKGLKGHDQVTLNNAFICTEIFRVFSKIFALFPGVRKRVRNVVREERKHRRFSGNSEQFLSIILDYFCSRRTSGFARFAEKRGRESLSRMAALFEQIGCNCSTYRESLEFLLEIASEAEGQTLMRQCFSGSLHPLSFFPDFMFPCLINTANPQDCAVDLKQNRDNNAHQKDAQIHDEDKNNTTSIDNPDSDNSQHIDQNRQSQKTIPVGYFYDEWNEHDKDYYENWCCLNEKKPKMGPAAQGIAKDLQQYSQYVRRIFEKLKPDEAKREKYLQEGDIINTDLLTEFISQRKARISAKQNFYEKPYIKKRDLAVAILLDLSGSTGEEIQNKRKIIDLERDSAYILGEGLNEIGDRFSIFGFTGNGREHSEFYIYKEFEQEWNQQAKSSLSSASAGSSTRMGVAIRHTGYKFRQVHAKQKIMILITDGKPMDSGYDPNSRYAQYDVRKANEENYKAGIDAFCISTDENKIEDLEIMFPFHRYVIIRSMIQLPRILSQFYLKLTK